PTDERITPTSVAVDQGVGLNGGRRLYVSTNTGQVLVYEDPFATDTRPDYELLGLPGGAVKVESFGEDLLAVHNTVSVFFYREGSPDRLTFQTSGSGVSTLSSPCTAGSISAIAGGASNLFLACSASAGTCPGGVASPPADCSNGSTAAACYTTGCGVIHAYQYVSDVDVPNQDNGLPIANAFPPVFSGFALISDMKFSGNALFVGDSRSRVLRLSMADTAATNVLRDPMPADAIPATQGTQNIWEDALVTGANSTDPDLDLAFGQDDFSTFEANRGFSNGLYSAQGLQFPASIALDAFGGLWAVDSVSAGEARVLRYTDANSSLDSVADSVLGQPNFQLVYPNTIEAAGFGMAMDVAVDWRTETVYVADPQANRVLQFDSIASTTGAEANRAIGQANLQDYRANRGQTVDGLSLNNPQRVSVDPNTG
ncbi:MAG: hypothetical protein AAFY60_17485, partial [Myxococcota bacterium]